MRCEEARELILTDYADGELDSVRRNELARHILSCAACGALETSARSGLREIFAGTNKIEPPAYLWELIKGRIAKDGAHEGWLSNILTRIRDISFSIPSIPRSAMAFAAAAAIIIAVLAAVPAIRGRALDNYLYEQADFMMKLDAAELNGDNFFDIEVKTGIENIL